MNLLKKVKSKSKINKQTTFCYCPHCKNELVSSESFVSNEEFVTFKCSNCELISKWNFDIAPVAMLVSNSIEDVKSEARLKKIEEHFKNITDEEFEDNLIKCGIEIIEPCEKSNIQIILRSDY